MRSLRGSRGFLEVLALIILGLSSRADPAFEVAKSILLDPRAPVLIGLRGIARPSSSTALITG